jgi:hypothetical protein
MRRPFIVLPIAVAIAVAVAVVPTSGHGATTTTSVSIRAGAPARLVSVPPGGPVAGDGDARLQGLRLVDASGGRTGWTVTASAERLHDGRRALPPGSLILDGASPVDAGGAVVLGRGGGGTWNAGAERALHVTAPPALRPGRYASIVTLTLAIGP